MKNIACIKSKVAVTSPRLTSPDFSSARVALFEVLFGLLYVVLGIAFAYLLVV